jgi:superfamily II DNA or RNA helicase
MSMELVLRAHQTTILDKLRHGFAAGNRAQVLYGPCAFGKTEVAISMMHAAAQKGRRSAMVLDRRVLCTQTSARLWKYGIDHGVMMAGSDR